MSQETTYLTVKEVAASLKYSETHVRRLFQRGVLSGDKTKAGTIRFTQEQVDAFVKGDPPPQPTEKGEK